MKYMMWLLIAYACVSCTMNDTHSKPEIFLRDTNESKYKVGQVWKYRTRLSESKSRFTVVKVEQSNTGTIVHIYISNVKVKTDISGTHFSTQITHSPFSEAALDASQAELIGKEDLLPDYKEGYEEWRESFLNRDAGVFSIPVSQSIEYMERTMLNGTSSN